MLRRGKYLLVSCVGGMHFFLMAYVGICFILLENISYWMNVLLEGMHHRRTWLTV